MRRTTACSLIVLGLVGCASSTPKSKPTEGAVETSGQRRFIDGLFRSEARPKVRIRVEPRLEYVGSFDFVLKKKAAVQRHHWVEVKDGRVESVLIFQFEGFLPGVLGSYRFKIPEGAAIAGSNFRFSPAPLRLGSHEFIHNTWAFDQRAQVRSSPGAEADRTLRFLEERGYRVDDAVVMSRYVRAVGADRRHELIIFYIEPLRRSGHTIDEFPDAPEPSPAFDRLSAMVTERGERAFQVLADEAP